MTITSSNVYTVGPILYLTYLLYIGIFPKWVKYKDIKWIVIKIYKDSSKSPYTFHEASPKSSFLASSASAWSCSNGPAVSNFGASSGTTSGASSSGTATCSSLVASSVSLEVSAVVVASVLSNTLLTSLSSANTSGFGCASLLISSCGCLAKISCPGWGWLPRPDVVSIGWWSSALSGFSTITAPRPPPAVGIPEFTGVATPTLE